VLPGDAIQEPEAIRPGSIIATIKQHSLWTVTHALAQRVSHWNDNARASASTEPDDEPEPVPTKPKQCHRVLGTEGAFDHRINQGTTQQHFAGVVHHPPIADPMLAPILVQEGNAKYKAGPLHDGSFAEPSSRSPLIIPKHTDE